MSAPTVTRRGGRPHPEFQVDENRFARVPQSSADRRRDLVERQERAARWLRGASCPRCAWPFRFGHFCDAPASGGATT